MTLPHMSGVMAGLRLAIKSLIGLLNSLNLNLTT